MEQKEIHPSEPSTKSFGIFCLAFSPDGKKLAVGCTYIREDLIGQSELGQNMVLLHMSDEHGITKMKYLSASDHCVMDRLAFSYDGNTLASILSPHATCLWNVNSGLKSHLIQGLEDEKLYYHNLNSLIHNSKIVANRYQKKNQLKLFKKVGYQYKHFRDLNLGKTGSLYYLSFICDSPFLVTLQEDLGDSTLTIKHWKFIDLANLASLPIQQKNIDSLVKEALQDKEISTHARAWLEYMKALIRWQKRFDIEVEGTSQLIDVDEFNIEIED